MTIGCRHRANVRHSARCGRGKGISYGVPMSRTEMRKPDIRVCRDVQYLKTLSALLAGRRAALKIFQRQRTSDDIHALSSAAGCAFFPPTLTTTMTTTSERTRPANISIHKSKLRHDVPNPLQASSWCWLMNGRAIMWCQYFRSPPLRRRKVRSRTALEYRVLSQCGVPGAVGDLDLDRVPCGTR